jgi:hypothetical protein
MKSSSTLVVALGAILIAALGCSGGGSPTEPTDPVVVIPAEIVTDTFTGSISQMDLSCHHFETSERADITMRLIDIQPLVTLTVGMVIGLTAEVVDGAEGELMCTPFAADSSVQVPATLLSGNLGANLYCVCILDVGNIFKNRVITYTVEVDHSLPPVA